MARMRKRNPLVVGLDVGTYKIGVIVAELAEGGVEITGIGTAVSRGLKKGVVVNIEATVESIRRAVDEAELMAGCEIRSVIAGAAGSHLKGFNSHGVVAVKNREVGPGDVERVIDAARAVALPADREVLHVLPQEFIVDDQDGIKEPVGMAGVRLEARVHIVTGAVSSGQNLVKCCNRAGLHVRDVLGGPLADVIEPRAEEMLQLVKHETERAGCDGLLTSGLVLTGGGAALAGLSELAERVFHIPVRLGVPLHLTGLVDAVASPMYSTAVGLVLHGLRQQGPAAARGGDGVRGQIGVVRQRMVEWLREFF